MGLIPDLTTTCGDDLVLKGMSKATPLEFLQAVYANEGFPISVRMRAAIEAAQYVHPKLAVTATVGGGDFADQLERAIDRSRKIIEAKPMISVSSDVPSDGSDTKPPVQPSNGGDLMIPDRRFRRP